MTLPAAPLKFRPVVKQIIWGGRKLGKRLNKPIGDGDDYAESWEVVDHGEDQSVVDGGPCDGMTLGALLSTYGERMLGRGVPHHQFPLLLKYLDCNRVLSVQVHPNDEYAGKMSPPDRGKTEAWYVVDADPGALIYAGLKEGVDREAFGAAIEAGRTEDVLHSFEPAVGDTVFIPAGTVHALGAGLLIAEIQQSSDTTFRLFDWNRVDADGNARQLHLEQGLEVSDYTTGPIRPRSLDPATGGWQTAVMSDKFALQLLHRGVGELPADDRFKIVTVPRGRATLEGEGFSETLEAGQTRLLPAIAPETTVTVADGGTVMAMTLPKPSA